MFLEDSALLLRPQHFLTIERQDTTENGGRVIDGPALQNEGLVPNLNCYDQNVDQFFHLFSR